jgi:hypothetical protein
MNLNGFQVKRSWPNFKVLSWHSPGGAEENTKISSQDSQSPDQDLNLGPLACEAVMLTTRTQRLV